MLREMVNKLPASEKKIAEFIIESPQEAISYTAQELGERSQTSGAAVIRLCKSLGLNGLQELKLRVAGDLQKTYEVGYRDISPNEPLESILKKMTTNSIQALSETADIINFEELQKAADALFHARSIHFFGVGSSAIIAQDAQQKFLRINKHVTTFSDVHMAAMLAANATEEDVVFGISFSGKTTEVTKVLELANQTGAKTISLTSYGQSPVSNRASINLFSSASRESVFRSGATSSRLAQLHVIDILFMSVATMQYEESIERLDQTRAAIDFIQGNEEKNKGSKK
ncbi:MurR/RpiR family transcriptional regulator [Anaerobacillus alkaliphilus]|uniref:MurR/RpiR family transcriptional regulator n=1 Tax=Anaerobacillus alkaliphilus TaxID=1548597 RepID=A0A4Q0VXQ8_9BACI|nr:MurR/RpiR family transcriptional regulator [Anaerobacillus alkaliphilus]RXJ02538.1 MurR/RpiR family transcriptional regulator [Anaerobacillus alkaliphilus]